MAAAAKPSYDWSETIRDIGWAQIQRVCKGNPGKNPTDAAETCQKVFEMASDHELGLVLLGPGAIRTDKELATSFGTLTEKKTGGIFAVNPWSTLVNDVFILASALQGKDFVVLNVGKKVRKNTLADRSGALTGTGRELALLQMLGYERLEEEVPSFGLPKGKSVSERPFKELWQELQEVDPSALVKFAEPS